MPTIVRKNGRLVIRVKDSRGTTDILPAAYLSYCPADADYEGFFVAGYRLFSFCVYLGDCPVNEDNGTLRSWEPGLWRAPDVFDFSPLDSGMARILGADFSREAYVLLRINLNMPAWWRDKYPDEVMHLAERRIMQSIASHRWRRDATHFLRKLRDHIAASPYASAIIGWQVAAMHTEEWIHPGSCASSLVRDDPLLTAYRAWCASTYGSMDRLAEAWGRPLTGLEDIHLPTATEITERQERGMAATSYRRVRDFYDCLNACYADTVRCFTRTVKSLFSGQILCGTFGGYIGQLPDHLGHTAIGMLIDEPSVDFFASPFAYNNARAGDADWIYHAPMESVDRAGKLWFAEADVRTDLTRPLSETRPDVCPPELAYFRQSVFFGPDTREETLHHLLRAFAKCLCSRNGFWWFDMWGGWYRDTDIMACLARLRALYDGSIEREDVASVSEVAVVLDSRASASVPLSAFYTSVTQQLVELGYLGAPYDLLLLDRVTEADARRYKLFLLLSPDTTAEAFTHCRAHLQSTPAVVRVCGVGETADASLYAGESLWALAEGAGVHLYAKGHIVYANSRYLAITAREDGNVPLCVPPGIRLTDPLGGPVPAPVGDVYTLPMKRAECRLFRQDVFP